MLADERMAVLVDHLTGERVVKRDSWSPLGLGMSRQDARATLSSVEAMVRAIKEASIKAAVGRLDAVRGLRAGRSQQTTRVRA